MQYNHLNIILRKIIIAKLFYHGACVLASLLPLKPDRNHSREESFILTQSLKEYALIMERQHDIGQAHLWRQ